MLEFYSLIPDHYIASDSTEPSKLEIHLYEGEGGSLSMIGPRNIQ